MSGNRQPGTFNGFHASLMVGAFFAVIVGVNLVMALAATGSWTGLVVGNAYVASQNFNATLKEARRQAAFGWNSAFQYQKGRSEWTLTDSDGRPVVATQATIRFMRPVEDKDDLTVALVHTGGGRYVADHLLEPGQWAVRTVAQTPSHGEFRDLFRLVVAADGEAR